MDIGKPNTDVLMLCLCIAYLFCNVLTNGYGPCQAEKFEENFRTFIGGQINNHSWSCYGSVQPTKITTNVFVSVFVFVCSKKAVVFI